MSDCAQCGEPPFSCRCAIETVSDLGAWHYTVSYLEHAARMAALSAADYKVYYAARMPGERYTVHRPSIKAGAQ